MSVARAAIIISALTVAAKALGVVRDAVLAHSFGASQSVDIYFASFRVPDLLFGLLVAGTLSVSFIPVFVRYLQRERAAAFTVASTIFNLALLVMGAFAVLGILFSRELAALVVPGFSEPARAEVASLTRILMLSPLLFALSSVLTSVLQSHKRFALAAVAPMFYNLGIIGGALLFYEKFGLPALAWGAVVGAAMHFLLQLPSAMRLGLRPFGAFDLGHPGIRQVGRLFLPRVFGLDLAQISMLASSVVGSFLSAGSLAVVYFAYNLEAAPIGIFAVAFAVAVFPQLSELAGKHDLKRFREVFAATAAHILFVLIPASALILLLRAQIVRLILGAGQGTQFSFSDTRAVASALGFFALSLFAQGLIPLLSRAFYALQNTAIPVIAGLVGAGVNIVLAVVFTKTGGAETLALAFSIAVLVNMAILFIVLRRMVGDLGEEMLILRAVKIATASVVMGLCAYVTLYVVAPLVDMQTYAGILVQTIAASVVALVVYLGAGFLIGLPEAHSLLKMLRAPLEKFSRLVLPPTP